MINFAKSSDVFIHSQSVSHAPRGHAPPGSPPGQCAEARKHGTGLTVEHEPPAHLTAHLAGPETEPFSGGHGSAFFARSPSQDWIFVWGMGSFACVVLWARSLAMVRPVLAECAARPRQKQGGGQGRPGWGAAPCTGPPPLGGGQVATARGSADGRQSGSKFLVRKSRSPAPLAPRLRTTRHLARHLATARRHANTGRVLEHQLAGHT